MDDSLAATAVAVPRAAEEGAETEGAFFPYRVFGVGFNKTGTSSLSRALRKLSVQPVASQALVHRTGILDAVLERGDYEPALRFARMYRAFEDRPWNVWEMYRHLDERYPGSRFVLTVRDEESWWHSVERWITVSKPHVAERYRLHLRAPSLERNAMVDAYRRYNQQVIDHFRGRDDDFLVFDVVGGDGWEPLCGLLDLPVPRRDFPHANPQTYDRRDAAPQAPRERRRKRGFVQLKGIRAPLATGRCVGCGVPLPVGRHGPRSLIGRLPNWVKEPYRRVQRQAFVPARDDRDAEARAAALRDAHPGLTVDDLAAVTCFFNPCGYRSRLDNYHRFREAFAESGLPLVTVELAFGDDPFQLGPEAGEVLRLRSRFPMWQKERLLNVGIRHLLGRGYRKIAWIDADVVFTDRTHWPWHVAAALEEKALCQVFGQVLVEQDGGRTLLPGVSAIRYHDFTGCWMNQNRRGPSRRTPFGYPLGYSGFGWAARAEVLEEVELFDRAVVGGGDKLIYAASLGLDERHRKKLPHLLDSTLRPCRDCGHANEAPAYVDDYLAWAERWDAAVGGRVGWTDRTIRSLFHGDRRDRRYTRRRDILLRHGYDPADDLELAGDGTWRWASDKPDLHLEVGNYFFERREDS